MVGGARSAIHSWFYTLASRRVSRDVEYIQHMVVAKPVSHVPPRVSQKTGDGRLAKYPIGAPAANAFLA